MKHNHSFTTQTQPTEMKQPLVLLKGHTESVRAFAVLEKGKTIVTASNDRTLKLWSIRDDSCSWSCIWSVDFDKMVCDVAVINDSTLIAVSGGCVFIIDVSDGRIRSNMKVSERRLWACVPIDETVAVVGDGDGNIMKIGCDTINFRVLGTIKNAHTKPITRICEYGDKIASCSWDETANLLHAHSLKLEQLFCGHTDMVYDVSFDDKYLVSCSHDTTIRVYNVKTANLVTTIKTHKNAVHFVFIIPQKSVVLSGGSDGIIAFHDLPTGNCIATYNVEIQIRTASVLSSGFLAVSGYHTETVGVFEFEELKYQLSEPQAAPALNNTSTTSQGKEKTSDDIVKDKERTVRHQFKAFSGERGLEKLSTAESADAMNMVFKVMGVEKAIDGEKFEDEFMEISEEVEVSEDEFVDVFHAIMKKVEATEMKRLMKEYVIAFDRTNRGRSSASARIKFATRVLQRTRDDLKKRGILNKEALSEANITEEAVSKFDADGDGKLERSEFVSAGLYLVHGINNCN